MKKEVILLGFILIFILPFAFAQENITSTSSMKTNAVSCINQKILDKGCSNLGLEDQIFALLSVKQCKSDLISQAQEEGCFGIKSCTIKTTSQAALALSDSGSDAQEYIDWILSKNDTANGIEWLAQIETSGAASCTITDSNSNNYQVSVGEDKKITSTKLSKGCLSVDSTGYWLEVNSKCSNQEFEISCDQDFFTNMLFRKASSQALYVLSDSPETASAGGTTLLNQQEALCFTKGNKCNYEGTLWGVSLLKKLGYDVSSYLPYLMAFQTDNEKYLPESFLYYLTGEPDFAVQLGLKQKANRYWDEAYDRYYDSAVALLNMPDSAERDNAINWLGDVQGGDGCWASGSISKTGFLVYSLWPTASLGGGDETPVEDCVDSGNYCISDIECSDALGDVLEGDCPAFEVCCSVDKLAESCTDMGGEVCDSTQTCNGGYEDTSASDLLSDEICCVYGSCQDSTPQQENTCSQNLGSCRVGSCLDNEEQDYTLDCDFSDEICCTTKEKTGGHWWIWLLIILIILTILAIIFREKLRDFYMQYKSKGFGKPKSPPKGKMIKRNGIPPQRPIPRRPLRKILPPSRAPPRRGPPTIHKPRPPQKAKSTNEIDDVLKKLKEMGK